MDKPLSIVIRETQNQLIDLLNTSNLPIDVLVYILTDLTTNVKIQSEENYQNDLKLYEETINGSN